eukprot:4079496-Prymnesium_polylepis.1
MWCASNDERNPSVAAWRTSPTAAATSRFDNPSSRPTCSTSHSIASERTRMLVSAALDWREKA